MSTANEHNVSCSWRDLRFVDEIQNSKIDLLESLIATLAANCYFGDYRVINELLGVERLMSQREEEKCEGLATPSPASTCQRSSACLAEIHGCPSTLEARSRSSSNVLVSVIGTGTQCIFIIMTTLPTGILL